MTNENMEQRPGRAQEAKQIAGTIVDQIKAIGGWQALAAWGYQKPLAIMDYLDKGSGMYYLGGLSFLCNGMKSGVARVTVMLNSRDLYDVFVKKLDGLPIGEAKDVFCEDLEPTIDNLIERDR
jgi:hypothetical protein